MGKTKTAFVGETFEEDKKNKKKLGGRDKVQKPKKVHIAGLKGGQKIKVVEAEPIQDEDIKMLSDKDTKQSLRPGGLKKKVKRVKVRSKKYQEAKAKVKAGQIYELADAIKLVKETSYSKFDGSVEMQLVVKKVGTSANVTLKKLREGKKNGTLIKTEKEAPLMHIVVGKVSQVDVELIDNAQVVLRALGGDKQIVRAYIKASMGPSIKVAI